MEVFFTKACRDRTGVRGFKLQEGRLRSDVRGELFTMRVVGHQNRLPRAAVGAPSLAVSRARLDGAGGNLVQWKVSLPGAGGFN